MAWDEIEWISPIIAEKIDEFNEKWPCAAYGPAHIVLDDYNIYDSHITFCLNGLDKYESEHGPGSSEYEPEELTETRKFLMWLMSIPEDARYGAD